MLKPVLIENNILHVREHVWTRAKQWHWNKLLRYFNYHQAELINIRFILWYIRIVRPYWPVVKLYHGQTMATFVYHWEFMLMFKVLSKQYSLEGGWFFLFKLEFYFNYWRANCFTVGALILNKSFVLIFEFGFFLDD